MSVEFKADEATKIHLLGNVLHGVQTAVCMDAAASKLYNCTANGEHGELQDTL